MSDLTTRLQAKLKQLDGIHRQKCALMATLDEKIRHESAAIANLPTKKSQLKHVQQELEAELLKLSKRVRHEESKLQAMTEKEDESTSRLGVRLEILAQVCDPALESGIIKDAVDVRTAEIRRQKNAIHAQIDQCVQQHAAIQVKIDQVQSLLDPATFSTTVEKLQASVNEKLEEKKHLEQERQTALLNLTECQRLVEDVEERRTLLDYAKSNGLPLPLGTTDELIQVCRTHQEKVAAKNALVDRRLPLCAPQEAANSTSSRRRTSRQSLRQKEASVQRLFVQPPPQPQNQEESYTEESDEEECNCDECRYNRQGSVKASESTFGFEKRTEAQRKKDGFTIAATVVRRPSAKQENGWTSSLW